MTLAPHLHCEPLQQRVLLSQTLPSPDKANASQLFPTAARECSGPIHGTQQHRHLPVEEQCRSLLSCRSKILYGEGRGEGRVAVVMHRLGRKGFKGWRHGWREGIVRAEWREDGRGMRGRWVRQEKCGEEGSHYAGREIERIERQEIEIKNYIDIHKGTT